MNTRTTPRMYLIDTHPLLWALTSPARLTPRVKEMFEQMPGGSYTFYIPTIVLTELLLVAERQWLSTSTAELLEAIRMLQHVRNYILLPLMPETVLASNLLANDILDIFDRLIVAEARRLRTTLITCDRDIIASGLVDVLWE